jgi:hypothetical protein
MRAAGCCKIPKIKETDPSKSNIYTGNKNSNRLHGSVKMITYKKGEVCTQIGNEMGGSGGVKIFFF